MFDEFREGLFQKRKSKQNSISETKLNLSQLAEDEKPLTSEYFLKFYKEKQKDKGKSGTRMAGQNVYRIPDREKLRSLQLNDKASRIQ